MSTRQTIQIILDRIAIAKAYRAEFGADDLDIYNSETITICEWSRMLWELIEEAHSEALSAIQSPSKVSLVKSAPATHSKLGDQVGRVAFNHLGNLFALLYSL